VTSRQRRVRAWAGNRLRSLTEIGTRHVIADLRGETSVAAGQATTAVVQLSDLASAVSAMQRDLTAFIVATGERTDAQLDHNRSVSQSLKYLSSFSISDRAAPPGPDLTPYEMRVYSQNGEDGVLLEILRRIGSDSRRFLEIGAQAAEANCIALAVLLGWEGTVVEADPARAEDFRRTHGVHKRVAVSESFVTRDNVNELANGGPVDVFSLDIDGNDYWVWQALDRIAPRVVIVEYNAKLDPQRALVQPYDPRWVWQGDDAFGASRGAMVQLGTAKGYRLVHAETAGVNLFFVRADVAGDHFLSPDEVAVRAPNYYLVAATHPDAPHGLEYMDLDAT
jgi:hypothetical protein